MCSGTVGMAEHSMPIGELGGKSATQRILGIIGLAKLANTSVLAVITSAEKVLLPIFSILASSLASNCAPCIAFMSLALQVWMIPSFLPVSTKSEKVLGTDCLFPLHALSQIEECWCHLS